MAAHSKARAHRTLDRRNVEVRAAEAVRNDRSRSSGRQGYGTITAIDGSERGARNAMSELSAEQTRLAQLWEEHMRHEFQTCSTEDTLATIETTGLADPAPILHTLMTDPIVAAGYVLDGVVTTVDAVNGAGTLDKQPEAVKQAAVADRLLLTKTDLADPVARQEIEARLSTLNPSATIVRVAQGVVDP